MAGGDGGYDGTNTVFEIAEINRRLALVGDVMRDPQDAVAIAVLHSTHQDAWDIATLNSPKIHTPGARRPTPASPGGRGLLLLPGDGKGMVPNWIDEVEATEKGADFLKQWKVIMCPRLTTATPAFRKVLEGYVAAGGKLIQFKGDALTIREASSRTTASATRGRAGRKSRRTGRLLLPMYAIWDGASGTTTWRRRLRRTSPTGSASSRTAAATTTSFSASTRRARRRTCCSPITPRARQDRRGVKAELIPAETTVTVRRAARYTTCSTAAKCR